MVIKARFLWQLFFFLFDVSWVVSSMVRTTFLGCHGSFGKRNKKAQTVAQIDLWKLGTCEPKAKMLVSFFSC